MSQRPKSGGSQSELFNSAFVALDQLECAVRELSPHEHASELSELIDFVMRARKILSESVEKRTYNAP